MNVSPIKFGFQEACILVGAAITQQILDFDQTLTKDETEKAKDGILSTILTIVLTGPIADGLSVSTASPKDYIFSVNTKGFFQTFFSELIPGLLLFITLWSIIKSDFIKKENKTYKENDKFNKDKINSIIILFILVFLFIISFGIYDSIKNKKFEPILWQIIRYITIISVIIFTNIINILIKF